jgi:hypothetical protein
VEFMESEVVHRDYICEYSVCSAIELSVN